jgi:hypothetical protein
VLTRCQARVAGAGSLPRLSACRGLGSQNISLFGFHSG